MDDQTAEKIARNNAMFRDANDKIETKAARHGFDRDQPLPFICECSDRRCVEIILLSAQEYSRVRSNPRWFAHAPDHEEELDGAVAPVERHERYVLVEKIEHAGEIADRLATEGATE